MDEHHVLTEEDFRRAIDWLKKPIVPSNDHVCFVEKNEDCWFPDGHHRPILFREVGKPLVTEEDHE